METKKIIITGGATRIGSAIAKSLAGYDIDITIHFNKSKKSAQQLKTELEEIGSKVHLIKADLGNINQVKKILPFAIKKMKGLDCLINNASLFEKDNLENFSEKSFSEHIDINLKAPSFLIKDLKKYVKNKEANVSNFFALTYNEKLFENAGVDKILGMNHLEADDCLALTAKHLYKQKEDNIITIITSDHDYIQLSNERINLINLKYKSLLNVNS